MVAHGMPAAAHRPPVHPRDELSICAQVSLRYEADHLLPWVAWHSLIGFDRVLLYIDDSGHLEVDPAVHARITAALEQPTATKLVRWYSMRAHNMTGPGDQHAHCVFEARKHATWMAMWDIDEVPALGAPPTPGAAAAAPSPLPSLKALLRALPSRTSGVLVPRINFDCGGYTEPPPLLSYEAFTRRMCDSFLQDAGGKVIWRGDAQGVGAGVRPDTFHTLTAKKRSSLSDPDGEIVRSWTQNSNKSGVDWWKGVAEGPVVTKDYNLGGFAALTAAATALRLNHYITRSTAECRRKKEDQARAGADAWGHSWRVGGLSSDPMCECPATLRCGKSGGTPPADLSLAQHVPAIKGEMGRLFGAAAVAPPAAKAPPPKKSGHSHSHSKPSAKAAAKPSYFSVALGLEG